jgi:hypothetical protein
VQYDDNTADSMPDALILRDTTSEPLEIVQDESEAGRRLSAQLKELGGEVSLTAGSPSWRL